MRRTTLTRASLVPLLFWTGGCANDPVASDPATSLSTRVGQVRTYYIAADRVA